MRWLGLGFSTISAFARMHIIWGDAIVPASPAARRHVRDVDALFRLLVVMRQRLFEFLLDAERVSRGARPEFPQGVPIALALENVMRRTPAPAA